MRRILPFLMMVALVSCSKTQGEKDYDEYNDYCKQFNFAVADTSSHNYVAITDSSILLPRCAFSNEQYYKYVLEKDAIVSERRYNRCKNSSVPRNKEYAKHHHVGDIMNRSGDTVYITKTQYEDELKDGCKLKPLNQVETNYTPYKQVWDVELVAKREGLYLYSSVQLIDLQIIFHTIDYASCPWMDFKFIDKINNKYIYFAPYYTKKDCESSNLEKVDILFLTDELQKLISEQKMPSNYANIVILSHDFLVKNCEMMMLYIFGENR